MSLDSTRTEDQPLTHIDELIRIFHEGERAGVGLVGLEHEKLLVHQGTLAPVAYEGPNGVGAVFAGLEKLGWLPYREQPGSPVIAAHRGQATLSLEPGGQFELSATPWRTAREAHDENVQHLSELEATLKPLGLSAIALGYRPFGTIADMPWMPKSRYRIMRQTLGTRGSLSLDMMLMTATGQLSLDWKNEADCVRKTTALARLTPVLVAMFANSPIVNGAPSGFHSYRSHVWSDVDRARCGYVPAMLDGSFSYRAYTDWALDAPMLFLRRDGNYLDPKCTFRQLLERGYEGKPAQQSDWVDHLSTLFPEVRLKRVIEVRGADCNTAALTGGFVALLRGLVYDDAALDAAVRALPVLTPVEHLAFHESAQRDSMSAVVKGVAVADLAREVVASAREGLKRLAHIDAVAAGTESTDVSLLEPLAALVQRRRSPAQEFLARAERDGLRAAVASSVVTSTSGGPASGGPA